MRAGTTARLAVASACLVGLGACSSGVADPPRPTVAGPTSPAASATTPGRADAAAAALLEEARATVEAAPAVRFRTVDLTGAGAPATATTDGGSGNFEARVPWHGHRIEMRRVGDLTWTRAPVGFWTGLGYTRASALRAAGKWVVARSAQITQVERLFDPGALLGWLRTVGPGEVRELPRRRGADRALEVRAGGTRVEVGLPPLGEPGRLRLTSITVFRGDHPVSRAHLTLLSTPVALVAPDADDVLQQEALHP